MADLTRLEKTATRQHGLLTKAQLDAAGLDKRKVQRLIDDEFFARRGRGLVRLAGTRATWGQDVMAATLIARPAVASHRSALRLWDLRDVDPDVEITIRYPAHRKVRDAIVHRSVDLEPGDVTWIDAIPVTTPARSLTDAGLIFPEKEVERMVHHAVATSLVSRGDLWRIRRRVGRQGRNGAGIIGRILHDLPSGAEDAESGQEVLLRKICTDHGLPQPVAQIIIRVDGRTFRVDLGYPEQKVFLEFDGFGAHSGLFQIADDDWRQNLLVKQGWTPQRFTWKMLTKETAYVASTIEAVLQICEAKRAV